MTLTLDSAVSYMRKVGVHVTEEDIERALEALELPALAAELGDEPYWVVLPEDFQTIRNGGGAEVRVAASVWGRNQGHFRVKSSDVRFTPMIYVDSDDLDRWAIRLNDPDRQVPRKPATTWRLRPVQRERAYTPNLRQFLQAALDRGDPLPTALDVLRAWSAKPPHGISVSENLRSFKYAVDGDKVAEKEVSARNLGKAIVKHTELIDPQK